MKIIKQLIVFATLVIGNNSFAQKQANIWHFGIGLSLDFSSGAPVFTTGNNIYAPEGSASYSDRNGNLLFYTNGDTLIYNANDQVMFDMGSSGGNKSAEQSSVIIEAPCEPGKYYLFTMDGLDPASSGNGLNYFKIDMTLNGGLGGVVQPGVNLYTNSLEGLCAVRAKNKTDYFILINHATIGLGVYKVTSSGISLQSVFNYPPFGTKRLIKASPDGSKVFVVPDTDGSSSGTSSNSGVLLNFDNNTGTLSNPQSLSSVFYANPTNPTSTCNRFQYFEFSPNSRYLYLATCNSIQRFDLQNGQTVATVIFDFYNWTNSAGISQFQLGPDGNIYFCFVGQLLSTGQVVTELSRIRCPNTVTSVVERILPVPNGDAFGAMPNYPAWLFESYQSTYVSLGPDTVFLCNNSGSVSLDALNPGATYQWSNGSTAQTTTVSTPGTYSVTVNGPCGIGRDTIVVLDCFGEILANYDSCSLDSIPFSLYSKEPVDNITWNFGDPNSGGNNVASGSNVVHTFSQDGTYTITAVMSTKCSVDTFTKTITVYNAIPPVINIVSNDNCLENNISFSILSGGTISQVSWNFGDPSSGANNTSTSLTPTHLFSAIGTYNVRCIVTASCGVDTINKTISIVNCNCIQSIPAAFTPNGDGINDKWIINKQNCFRQVDVNVYNRYGSLVFSKKDYQNEWNGTYGSKPLPDGTYYYVVNAIRLNGSLQNLRGDLTILR